LIPKALKNAGLEKLKEKVQIQDSAVLMLIDSYAREAGVRGLERLLIRLCEKVSLKLVRNQNQVIEIRAENLSSLVGLPTFSKRKMYQGIPPAGISIGLAYNEYGGSILYIETLKYNVEVFG